ncbi:B- and T-lymphocyte attenuator-like [Etheostoma cragini]|uniref:B- and T-lymphocyte attenuator-like n=1 Tax=Etheostoma cragini TaxID=417921 RepID=UPI00155E4DA4|nr:B- and T-lymphocyte attenuator-like [Etheostoma cragini]
MTGGFLSVPIMRPHHCWTVLHVSILAGLLLTLNADSKDSACELEIRVHHGKVYEAVPGEDFRIHCPVTFCNSSPPTVSWYKYETTKQFFVPVDVSNSSHIKKEWTLSKPLEGISYLIFQKILRNDLGEYQCRAGGSMSHNINISVHGDGESNGTRNGTDTMHSYPENLWMYMYFAAGIVPFVIIVIILSVVSMRGCKGKPKKELQTENQYMAMPMVEQPVPHASLQPSPRGTPSAPQSRRSTRRTTPPSQPHELPTPRDNEEEGSSVVYAALNHQLPARAAARPPRRQQQETSEYAAIRVQDPSPNINYF